MPRSRHLRKGRRGVADRSDERVCWFPKMKKNGPKVCSSLENLRTFSETTGRTHLALKRVVPMLKTLAAAASVSIATCDSVFFVIPCRKSA